MWATGQKAFQWKVGKTQKQAGEQIFLVLRQLLTNQYPCGRLHLIATGVLLCEGIMKVNPAILIAAIVFPAQMLLQYAADNKIVFFAALACQFWFFSWLEQE